MLSAQLIQDVRTLLNDGPMLLSDLMHCLRRADGVPRRWKKLPPPYMFEGELKDAGLVSRSRPHGSGVATYIWTEGFDAIIDGRGVERPVY